MRFFLFVFLSFVLLSVNAESLKNKNFGDAIVSEVTSIYDGDTFTVNISEWPEIVGHRISIRVNGIDTPELKGKCQMEKKKARLAKQFTVGKLRNAKTIVLRNIKRGKYFRLVADVLIDGDDLAKMLLNIGYAVKYAGGTKVKDWCRRQSALLSVDNDLHSLTVNVTPSDSTVKIMNIKPKYTPGIMLKKGKYDILVKNRGYKKWRKWVVVDSDLSIDVVLDQFGVGVQKSSFSCVKKLCSKMSSCEEAYHQLNVCGYQRLDRDKDGVPCESICPGG